MSIDHDLLKDFLGKDCSRPWNWGNLLAMDTRWFQITILSCLFAFLQMSSDFAVNLETYFLYMASGIVFQWLFCFAYAVPFNALSVCISCTSLAILLRTSHPAIPLIASFMVVSSKFWLRNGGRHILNPSNFALVLCVVLFPASSWISPAQWGREVVFVFVLSTLGLLVTRRVGALLSSASFLLFYFLMKFAYATYMGDPYSITLLSLSSGGIYLFAFYMVSDPMTSPQHLKGKLLYSLATASLANYLELFQFWPTGVFHALILVCLFVPLLNKVFVGNIFLWKTIQEGSK